MKRVHFFSFVGFALAVSFWFAPECSRPRPPTETSEGTSRGPDASVPEPVPGAKVGAGESPVAVAPVLPAAAQQSHRSSEHMGQSAPAAPAGGGGAQQPIPAPGEKSIAKAAAALGSTGEGLQPASAGEEVRHAWRPCDTCGDGSGSRNAPFFVLDSYVVDLPTDYDPALRDATDYTEAAATCKYTVLLGEGVIGAVNFPTDSTYSTDLQCVWQHADSEEQLRTDATVQFMRYREGQVKYRNRNMHNPFSISANKDETYQAQYILCRSPVVAGPVKLLQVASPGSGWKVNGLAELATAHAPPEPPPADTPPPEDKPRPRRLVACVAPVYGSMNVRWLVEFVLYHISIGFAHLNIPMFDDEGDAAHRAMWAALRHFREQGLVSVHHWSPSASSGFTQRIAYEHAKYIAWDDCYMRNRGKADWLLFTDIDELPFSPAGQAVANPSQTLHTALQFCDTQFRDNGKVGCALTSVTVASVFMRVRSFAESHKLLLEEYSHGEAKPRCPFNCGPYHRGRQKYLVRAREPWLAPLLFWTHAIGGQDYSYADKIMSQIGTEQLHIRHYQGWWYHNEDRTELHPEGIQKSMPLSGSVMQGMHGMLKESPLLMAMYSSSPAQGGVTWGDKYTLELP